MSQERQKRQDGLPKKNKKKENVIIQKYAELKNGTFVKITQEYKNDMFIGDIYVEHTTKPIGSIYFPRSYIRSLEEIVINNESF